MGLEGLSPELVLLITILTPIILGLMEAAKQMFSIKKNYLPLIAVVVGLFVGFVSGPLVSMDIYLRLWGGALAGLASTGLYEVSTKRKGETKK